MQTVLVDGITKEYGNKKVLDSIEFGMKDVFTDFLGEWCRRKSTTMKIMAGLLSADSGRSFIKGKKVSSDSQYTKKVVGILPEDLPLYPYMNVKEFLFFVATLNGVDKSKLQEVDYIEENKTYRGSHRLIGNLSRGFKQGIGIAQAIVFNPRLLS